MLTGPLGPVRRPHGQSARPMEPLPQPCPLLRCIHRIPPKGLDVTDNPSLDPLTRRAGVFAVSVLAADAACHLFWMMGMTWPFPDERRLSLAVLGFPAPFT